MTNEQKIALAQIRSMWQSYGNVPGMKQQLTEAAREVGLTVADITGEITDPKNHQKV